jgi:hypothetical protein
MKKIISLEKFNQWLDKNREYINLGSIDGKAGWNLKSNYKNKPFNAVVEKHINLFQIIQKFGGDDDSQMEK